MLALVTATRNSIVTLPDCLASVGANSPGVKHFFVDGASTDGTVEFLHSFASDKCNTVYQAQDGIGLYEALNQGIRVAVEDPEITHVGLLHSDDRLVTENYASYLSEIENNSADVFFSDIQFHNAAGRVVRVWRSGHFSSFKLNTGWMPPHPSMIVKKDVYQELGLYNPAFGTAADYEWIVRVLLAKGDGVHYFPKRTLSMLVGGASSASLKARLRANAMDGSVWAHRSRGRAAMIRLLKPARKVGQFLFAKRRK